MSGEKRDKTKVDPLSGAEERDPAPPLNTVPPGMPVDAIHAVIPGTGEIIRDADGKEAKRVVDT